MVKRVLRFGAGAVLAAVLVVPVVLLPAPSFAVDRTILALDDGFEPESIQIRPGDRLSWRNEGQATHTVDAQGNAPQPTPQQLSPGEDTDFLQFNSLGTFTYFLDNRDLDGYRFKVTVTNNPSSPSATPTGSGTRTITIGPTPRPPTTRRPTTRRPTPTATTTTLSPTPTPTPTPSPTETFATESSTPIPTLTEDEAGSSGNTQALIAVGVVVALGILGFLIYRRTLAP